MSKCNIINRSAELTFNEESRTFSGYGIVFNSDSVPMTIYDRDLGAVDVYEQITRESMEGAEMGGMIAAINHDFSKILGRTDANTLSLSTDEKGVKYRIDALPNTTYANDLKESVSRGRMFGLSFTFSIDWEAGYDIQERQDGSLVAKPNKITRIYEMGPVTNPAYPATTAENRSDGLFNAVSEFLQRKSEAAKTKKNIDESQMSDLEKRLRLEEAAL